MVERHIGVIKDFIEKYYNGEVFDEEDVREFIENGLMPYIDLSDSIAEKSYELIEEVADIIPAKQLKKIRNSNLYQVMDELIELLSISETKH